jgi:hypothetical protein
MSVGSCLRPFTSVGMRSRPVPCLVSGVLLRIKPRPSLWAAPTTQILFRSASVGASSWEGISEGESGVAMVSAGEGGINPLQL